MSESYRDPVIEKYFDLIKGIVGEGLFKVYYNGEPIRVPISNLPAIIISKDETRVSNALDGGSNVEDVHLMALTLTVITDIRDDIQDDKSIAPGTATLYDIMEGRESATLKLKTKSLLHILRNNVDLDTSLGLRTDLGSITRINFGLAVGKREVGSWSVEAQLEFIASFVQIR